MSPLRLMYTAERWMSPLPAVRTVRGEGQHWVPGNIAGWPGWSPCPGQERPEALILQSPPAPNAARPLHPQGGQTPASGTGPQGQPRDANTAVVPCRWHGAPCTSRSPVPTRPIPGTPAMPKRHRANRLCARPADSAGCSQQHPAHPAEASPLTQGRASPALPVPGISLRAPSHTCWRPLPTAGREEPGKPCLPAAGAACGAGCPLCRDPEAGSPFGELEGAPGCCRLVS